MSRVLQVFPRRLRHPVRVRSHGWRVFAGPLILGVSLLACFGPAATQAQSDAPSGEVLPVNETKIEFETTIIELTDKTEKMLFPDAEDFVQKSFTEQKIFRNEEDLGEFVLAANQKNIDFLNMPKVTTPAGKGVIMRMIHEFQWQSVPSQMETEETLRRKNVGFTMGALGTFTKGGRILCRLSPTLTVFQGYINYGSEAEPFNQPVFDDVRLSTTFFLKSGEHILLGPLGWTDRQALADSRHPLAPVYMDIRKAMYVMIGARAVPPEKNGQSASLSQEAPSVTAGSSLPYGTPVSGKVGFVVSPYVADGFVDVRGYVPGAEIKCPYTGKLFRVP